MAPREVSVVEARIDALVAAARRLRPHLTDVHSLAYEKSSSVDDVKVAGGAAGDVGTTGDLQARHLWSQLERKLRDVETVVRACEVATLNYLSAGESPPETRGSLISKREYRDRIRNQRRAADRGEHISPRLVDQPPYPGSRR